MISAAPPVVRTRTGFDATVYALLYRRVSSDEQAEAGQSLAAQEAEVRRYASQHGMVIAGEYSDILSGTKDSRPGYQQLLTDARAMAQQGKRAAVVVAALDRFGRRMFERVRSREELKRLGTPTHSVREGGEVSDLVANVLSAVAEEEVRRLGERVSKSWEHIRGRGWHMIGRTPFGYRVRSATEAERAEGAPAAVLDVDPIAGPHASAAFARVSTGTPIWDIIRTLQALPAEVRGGRGFNKQSVKRMLQSPTYIAREQGCEQDPDTVLSLPVMRWPALVSDGTWHAVQERLERNRRIPISASGAYLLTGFLYCKCGSRMHAQQAASGYYQQFGRYACSSKGLAGATHGCTFTATLRALDASVREQVADLLGVLDRIGGMPLALRRQLDAAWVDLQRDPDAAQREAQIAAATKARDTAKRRLTDASLALVDGTLSREAYAPLQERLSADLKAAEEALSDVLKARPAAAHRLPPLADVLAEAGGWRRMWQEGGVPEQRDVLASLVDRITAVREGRGRYTAAITWNPTGKALGALAELAAT